jgi:drug/metabolite transporter (DMT)-like permease
MAEMSRWTLIAGLVTLMLFCGTCVTLIKKLQYQTLAVGIDPALGARPFQKPWFCTFFMFIGEAMALVAYAVKRANTAEDEKQCELSWWGILWRSSVPAVLDLTATGLGSVGLLYITASSFQMLRGCAILFAAVLSRFWLQRIFEIRQSLGLSLIFSAMILVGYASASTADSSSQSGSGDAASGLFGVFLVVGAQVFQATQFVWEEKIMKKVFIPPWLLLGIEGIAGMVVMCTLVFPLLMNLPGDDVGGTQENIWDSLTMVGNSPMLVALFAVYLVCISTLNISAVMVTKVLSGVHRTLIQTGLRTMVIWTVGMVLYYTFDGKYGEPWSGVPSLLQLIGFAFFLLGSMLHSKLIDLPFDFQDGQYKKLPAGP